MSAPDRIWAVVGYVGGGDVRGEFAVKLEAFSPHPKPAEYTRRDPAALAADPMVQAMIAAALEGAGLAAANVKTGYHDGISGDWHPYNGPTMISATCAAIRALIPAPANAALEAMLAMARRETWERAEKLLDAAKAYAFESDCYDEETPTAMSAWRSARTKLYAAIAEMEALNG